MTEVTILQLYPEELGVTGDSGNVLALQVRLERASVPVTVLRHRIGESLPDVADLIVIGNGPLSAMRVVLDDLHSNAAVLSAWVDQDVPLLAVGGGMELLGETISTQGADIPGIGIFPITSVRDVARRVGYVTVTTTMGPIIGFEDHSSHTERRDAPAFGTVSAGVTGSRGHGDGVRVREAIGTRVQGPVLPLNPLLSDSLLTAALKRRGESWAPDDTSAALDRLAGNARDVILRHIGHVFSSI
jgi:CobQ-like glutamine amidotransferase family enzyme